MLRWCYEQTASVEFKLYVGNQIRLSLLLLHAVVWRYSQLTSLFLVKWLSRIHQKFWRSRDKSEAYLFAEWDDVQLLRCILRRAVHALCLFSWANEQHVRVCERPKSRATLVRTRYDFISHKRGMHNDWRTVAIQLQSQWILSTYGVVFPPPPLRSLLTSKHTPSISLFALSLSVCVALSFSLSLSWSSFDDLSVTSRPIRNVLLSLEKSYMIDVPMQGQKLHR